MRVLILAYTHMLSHVSRPMLVAHRLRERGHEVLFAGEGSNTRFISADGFEILPLAEPDPEALLANIRQGRIRFTDDKEVRRMVEADLALYRETEPDLVLSDFRFSSPLSAQIAGIRHAAIVNASSTEFRALPYVPLFDRLKLDWLPGGDSVRALLNRFNLGFEMFVFDNAMRIFRTISREYGLAKQVTATNCLTGVDLTLLADTPEYFPTRNLPANYHYIGPLTMQSRAAPPDWWPPDKRGGRLVYITMGTTGLEEFFTIVPKVVNEASFTAIITTGGQAAQTAVNSPGIYVEPFINGDLVMQAADLVICHGGNGTIYQALQHGVPIIGIPTLADQQFNMRMVERLGAGRRLSWEEFHRHPDRLLDIIDELLNDNQLQQNLERLQQSTTGYDAAGRACELIIELYNSR